MTVSFIVHGWHWPDATQSVRLYDRIRSAAPDVELLEAREDAARPRGAAAAINAAAQRASRDRIVVVEPWTALEADGLAGLAQGEGGLSVESTRDGLPRLAWPDARPVGDLLADLAADAVPRVGAAPPVPAFALARAAFVAAGGLDERLWSIGIVEDLAARLAPGLPLVAGPPTSGDVPPAWPLRASLARALAVRNRLVTAIKALPSDALGVELARVAAGAIREAFEASGLQDETFRFGGDWGAAERTLDRLLRPGAHGAAQLARHAELLLPLLALDAALDLVPALTGERARLAPAPPGPPHAGTAARVPAAARIPSDAGPAAADGASAGADLPRVSVIVVNWNGREHLRACFGSLIASDYPADRLEMLCVDNGSSDGSLDLVRAQFPSVRCVALPENRGFTGGNQAGVAASTGDVLVFFNNDMRVAPDAIRRLVSALEGTTACAAARVLSWDGRHIDFIRGSLNFEARGFQDFYGEPATGERSRSAETFFPNGGAFAVTRAAYDAAGGFDGAYFAYYEDVDLGWRLRLTGSGIRVEDRAVAFHRHGATGRLQPAGQKRFLMERNALWTAMKNYGEAALQRTLGALLLLAVRRILDEARFDASAPALEACAILSRRVSGPAPQAADLYAGGLEAGSGDLEPQAPGPGRTEPAIVLGFPVESLAALGAALAALPRLAEVRRAIQAERRADDEAVLPHFGRTFERLSTFASYQPIQDGLLEALELAPLFRGRARLLIVSHEAIAANMSGPAVRFLEIGRALCGVARVTIAMPGTPAVRDDRCTIAGFDPDDPRALRRLAEDADVLFVQGFTLARFPFLSGLLLPIVVDLYCPFTLEHLEQLRAHAAGGGLPAARADAAGVLEVQNAQLDQGDFFVCASEAQRDFWIGNLHSRGRINPLTYADDPTLRRLIDVVPFGLPDTDFAEQVRGVPPALKGVRPGIGQADRVLLWGGSLLDWQDPITVIDAMALLVPTHPDVRLFFMGTKHPNPLVAPMRVVDASRARAEALGLLDRHVFFNDWVPYERRARFLAEADIGISTHRDHLETHFAFRTRMLDYIWAGLPIVCTRGDVFADLVEARGLGRAVPPADPEGLAAAIRELLDQPDQRRAAAAALEQVAEEMRWSRVVAPLVRFCAEPRHAADHAASVAALRARLAGKYRVTKWLKRTALRAGVSELRIEQLKRWKPVRALMAVRNRLALASAARRRP